MGQRWSLSGLVPMASKPTLADCTRTPRSRPRVACVMSACQCWFLQLSFLRVQCTQWPNWQGAKWVQDTIPLKWSPAPEYPVGHAHCDGWRLGLWALELDWWVPFGYHLSNVAIHLQCFPVLGYVLGRFQLCANGGSSKEVVRHRGCMITLCKPAHVWVPFSSVMITARAFRLPEPMLRVEILSYCSGSQPASAHCNTSPAPQPCHLSKHRNYLNTCQLLGDTTS